MGRETTPFLQSSPLRRLCPISCNLRAEFVYRYIKMKTRIFFISLLGALVSSAAEFPMPGPLRDVNGKPHAVVEGPLVLAWTGLGCPMSKLYRPRLERLSKEFKPKGVQFLLVDSNAQDSPAELKKLAAKFSFPVVRDEAGRLARALKVKRTTEVLLLDNHRTVCYRGAVDDQFGFRQTAQGGVGAFRRPEPRVHHLHNALTALLAGKKIAITQTKPYGCALGLAAPPTKGEITFHEHIEPLLQVHCQECHHKGGGGPFALETYQQAKGWAKMIAEVTAEKRMPPWNADPKVGHFQNARGLSADKIKRLADWLNAGTPKGDPTQAPPRLTWQNSFSLGKPEHHITLPVFDVPAEGRVPYRYVRMRTNFKEDKWVQAAEFSSDTPEVVHHVLAFLDEGRGSRRIPDRPWSPPFNPFAVLQGADPRAYPYWIGRNRKYLSQYGVGQGGGLNGYFLSGIVGDRPLVYPAGRSKLLPAGATIVFQVHYNPNGTTQKSTSKLGLWFADERPREAVDMHAASTVVFCIPPGKADYEVRAQHRFQRNGLLLGLQPHMHYRGKSFRYVAKYPDGRRETLLNVPDYDFNWQHKYEFAEPKWLPRGTTLHAIGVYDNSAANPDNPDSSKEVFFGLQSDEEMFIGFFEVIWNAPKPAATRD